MVKYFSIKKIRKQKRLYFAALMMFVAVTNFAFIHHIVFEEHGINYHIIKDKSEVHDHCTICKVAEQQTSFLETNFHSPLDIVSNFSISLGFNQNSFSFKIILLRGPPQLLFS